MHIGRQLWGWFKQYHFTITLLITINTQAHLVLEKYFIVPWKGIFSAEKLFYIRSKNQHWNIIQICITPCYRAHAMFKYAQRTKWSNLKKTKTLKNKRDKMHLKKKWTGIAFHKNSWALDFGTIHCKVLTGSSWKKAHVPFDISHTLLYTWRYSNSQSLGKQLPTRRQLIY